MADHLEGHIDLGFEALVHGRCEVLCADRVNRPLDGAARRDAQQGGGGERECAEHVHGQQNDTEEQVKVLVVTGSTIDVAQLVADGWREEKPHDQVRLHHLPETAESAAAACGIVDISAIGPDEALDAIVRDRRIAIGRRSEHDGGELLLSAARERWGSLDEARRMIAGATFLTDDEVPLRGLRGAGARRAAEVGDDSALAADQAVSAFASAVESELARRDLMGGRPVRWSLERYSGAGGGLGFALLALGAVAEHARDAAARLTRLQEAVAEHELIVVVMPQFGVEELVGSVATATASSALDAALPVIAVVAEDHTSRRQRADLGVVGTYSTGGELSSVRALAQRVARTWSV